MIFHELNCVLTVEIGLCYAWGNQILNGQAVEVFMTREFEIDLSIRGEYDDTTYEIEAVEEALAEWNLTFPDEYGELEEVTEEEEPIFATSLLVEEVHVNNADSFIVRN